MNRLKELRKEKGLTQVELAHEIGTTKLTVSNWENEKHVIKSDKAQSLADYFGVSVGYLLGYEDKEAGRFFSALVSAGKDRGDGIISLGDKELGAFVIDYSVLDNIENIDSIEELDELSTDTLLANRLLDRLKEKMIKSNIVDKEYNLEIEKVMNWLIDFNGALSKQKAKLTKNL
ncbi:helix-turn-helix transcriptional regulator [Streptococcus dysgalactiae]|nr:helix-turn-helix transcriptional regulator [Streptococcus dysgalactiae]